jgi:hypothetical protein
LNDCEKYLTDGSDAVPIDDDHIGPLLLSPYGLKALVKAGQLTKEEREGLMGSGLPPSQYAYILLVWTGIHVMEGLKNGTLQGGAGFEENLLRQLATLRGCMFDIDDFRAGRMPLAYVQFVQVLVDSAVCTLSVSGHLINTSCWVVCTLLSRAACIVKVIFGFVWGGRIRRTMHPCRCACI